ncbi:hypothetical protein VKT23_000087 [Stygiomarasmius scandens]|uniref:KOW domain-containing protein n=1 Tax=Marasmiellus scandens TaxID=2682957 RepID=A0ABR1K5U2_9AGAR
MVFRNPFLDLQAYDSSDDEERTPSVVDDGESIPGGDDEEEGSSRAGDHDGGGVAWEDEDAPEDDSRLTGADFLDDLERRYDPRNFQAKSPITVPAGDDLLDKSTLHRDLLTNAVLMSERKQLFWKIKCNPGKETQVVFDIMNNFLPSDQLTAQRCIDLFASNPDGNVEDLLNALKSVLEVDHLPESFRVLVDQAVARKSERFHQSQGSDLDSITDSLPEQAFQYLLLFARSDSATMPEAEAELQKILKVDTLPQPWSIAIGKTMVEPGTSIDVALQALYAMKNDLVPANLQSVPPRQPTPFSALDNETPNLTQTSTPTFLRNTNVYHLFSAFCIPNVTGAVYLEAYLGENPQNTPIIEFLRQHPAVLRVGKVQLDRSSDLYHQKVWLQSIPTPEVGDLLSLSTPSIDPFTWVKVTRGRYKDDVGLVIRREVSTARRRLAVLLVPRLEKEHFPRPSSPPRRNHLFVRAENDGELSSSPKDSSHSLVSSENTVDRLGGQDCETDTPKQALGKRKRVEQAPKLQRLFSKMEWPEGEGKGRFVQLAPDTYRMDGHEFQYDLLLSHLPYSSVTDVDVRVDIITRRLFRSSQHPLLQSVHLPIPDNWVFFQNEFVEVIRSAPLTERQELDLSIPRTTYRKSGRIEQIESDRCLVHLDDYDDDIPEEYTLEAYGVKNLKKKDIEETDIWVNQLNLRKKISIGDHVEAVAGDSKGRYGFVVGNWGQQISVVEVTSTSKEPFTIDINSCRIVQARNDVTIPWLNQHITVIRGQYRGHAGIVADVSPAINGCTTIDVRLWGREHVVRLRHDDVVETCSWKPLCEAFPLLPHQQGFRQASWSTVYAPTVIQPAYEGGRVLDAQEYLLRQQRPPEPWLGKFIMVIKGPIKNQGYVRSVELFHRYKSGMRVLVEYDYISAEHGANPRHWVDYSWIRDPGTGLPLHTRYPLSNRDQRYWRPHRIVRAVSVSAPSRPPPPRFRPIPPPSHTNTPMGPVLLGADPFHWSVDSRLDGKAFLAFYKPLDPLAKSEKEVTATPNSTLGFVSCTLNGREHWRALPQEILLPADPAHPIKAQYNTKPLLVVRGEHTGKHVRQIYFQAKKGEPERLITATVFEPWGEPEEDRKDEHIVVRSEDCAVVPNDPNKEKWAELIKSLRTIASQKRQR